MPTREIIEVKTLGGNKACYFIDHIAGVEENTPTSSTLRFSGGGQVSVNGSGRQLMANIQNPINLLSEETAIKDTPPEKAAG